LIADGGVSAGGDRVEIRIRDNGYGVFTVA
jgi:hypothetical protein